MSTGSCGVTEEDLWELVESTGTGGGGELARHAEECPSCRARLMDMERVREGLESIGRAEAPPLPESIGPYRVVRAIGEGATGVVYEAQQTDPPRPIALKVLRPARIADEAMLRAFRREVRALARLDHPAIATIYDAGRTDEGQPYFAMQFVKGKPLDRHHAREDLDPRACVALLARVARAVQYAHERGILHRDLKPAHVLIDDRGDPHVLDFGLAQPLGAESGLSMSLSGAQVVGTLPYMSPEQVRGDDVDVRSDVYSLGVMLYELVTGLPPYEVPSRPEQAVHVIAETLARHPTTVERSIPRELGDVILKALEKDRSRRYETAAAFAEDLERYLSGKAVSARPASPVYKARVLVRRHKPAVAMAGFLVAGSLALLAVNGAFWSDSGEPGTPLQFTPVIVPDLVFESQPGNPREFDFSPDGSRLVYTTARRDWKVYLWERSTEVRRQILPIGEDEWQYQAPKWSPDGSSIAFLGQKPGHRGDSMDEKPYGLFLFDVNQEELRQISQSTESPSERIRGFVWTSEGDALICRTREGILTVSMEGQRTSWKGVQFGSSDSSGSINRLGGHSRDGAWLLVELRFSDLTRQTDIWILPTTGGRGIQVTHSDWFETQPTWGPDGETVYFASDQGNPGSRNLWKVRIDPLTGQPRGQIEQVTFKNDQLLAHPRFINEGTELVYGVEDLKTMIMVADEDDLGAARAVTRGRVPLLSPDGATIYYISESPEEPGLFAIKLDGSSRRQLAPRIEGDDTFGPSYDLTVDGNLLAYVAKTEEGFAIFVIPTADGEPEMIQPTQVRSMPRWSPDRKWIAYGEDDAIYVVSATDGERRRLAEGIWRWEPWSLRWSPNGDSIAALGYETPEDGSINAVFVVSFPEDHVKQITEKAMYKEDLKWHPSGKFLSYVYYAATTPPQQVWFAYPDGSPPRAAIERHEREVYRGVWTPDDGKRYLFEYDGVYELESGQVLSDAGWGHSGSLPRWSRDGRVRVWTTNQVERQLQIALDFK